MNLNSYYEDGYCIVDDFIDSELVSKINADIIKYISNRDHKNDVFCYPENLFRIIDPRFYKNQNFRIAGLYLAFNLLGIANTRIKEINRSLKLNKLTRIDSYFSEVSNKDITNWHCDQSFGGATDPGLYFNGMKENISTKQINKFFLHLTNVESGNGAFSYLPKSQKISIAIRNLINSGEIQYEPFHDLSDAIEIIEKYHGLFIKNSSLSEHDIQHFLKNAEYAISGKNNYSLEVKSGGMVIFNDLGYHQGTAPSKSSRMVVRYFY